MGLTRLSIQRPVFVIVLMTVFLVLGLRSRAGMQIDLNPKVDIPYVTVTTSYPGTGPAEMETLITKPIEDAVSSANQIRHIRSSSQYGVSIVNLEFELGADVNVAVAEVRQKVDAARRKMPRDIDPPVVEKLDVNAMPVLYAGLRSSMSSKETRYIAETVIRYRLAQVAGVGRADVSGGDAREIRVSVDKDRLQAYGLSITDVVAAIYRASANVPSGHITEGARDYDARLIGEFQSVPQLEELRLPLPNDMNLRLRDLATVKDMVKERDTSTRIWYRDANEKLVGSDAVTLVVTKLSDANTVDVVHRVRHAMTEMEKTLPGGMRFVVTQDQSPRIEGALEDVNVSLILGALLAVIVVFLFLHNLRGTLICAIAIPTSLIATFIPMHFAGFTLNTMTMLGLSLVVGILVDDSIVVLENIYRHLARGESPKEAAINGRSEIGMAALTITMADVVVFLPMAFMGGIVGRFFREFGLTVAVSTLFSLLVSFTVTPMLASRWYRMGEDLEHDAQRNPFFRTLQGLFNATDHGYRRLLGWALRHRPHVILTAVAALIIVMMTLGPKMGFQFVPATDLGQLAATIELPAGVSLEQTDGVVRQIEKEMAQVPEIQTATTLVGTIGGGFRSFGEAGRQYASIQMQLFDKVGLTDVVNPLARRTIKERKLRTRPDFAVTKELRERVAKIPGARITIVPISGFGGADAPVQMELLGFDLQQMDHVAQQIRSRLAAIPGIQFPDTSLRPGKPEAQVIVDREKAADLGLDVTAIGAAVRNAIAGNNDTKFREKGEEFDIRVQFAERDRDRVDDLGSLVVGSKKMDGVTYPIRLEDVAEVRRGEGPSKIDRQDRLRKVTVSAYLAPGVPAGNIQRDINKAIAGIPMGNIQMNAGGDAERQRTEFPYMISSFMLSIIFVYLLMAILFNSLLHPLTIQMSVPIALTGAIAALVFTHQTLSIISMIGFIMLVGLVQKNAILLIDYTNTLRGRGYKRDDAIREAGPTRLRPILMTTFAMVFGMLPIALGIGKANEQRAPLATAVIGGLILSTLLTLVVIPVVYSLFDDIQGWIARHVFRGAGSRSVNVDQVLERARRAESEAD
jgi:hydrophobic/amphiphilic exporter-1 (mainly G- bacteria), HAE1 family